MNDIHLFFPGQRVPDWIQRVEIEPLGTGDLQLTFLVPCEVERIDGVPHVRPIFPLAEGRPYLMCLTGCATGRVTVCGAPTTFHFVPRYDATVDYWRYE